MPPNGGLPCPSPDKGDLLAAGTTRSVQPGYNQTTAAVDGTAITDVAGGRQRTGLGCRRECDLRWQERHRRYGDHERYRRFNDGAMTLLNLTSPCKKIDPDT